MAKKKNNDPTHYVGIGASAGGLEAIETFFKEMPVDSGVAFAVIQHLSPDHKSLMPELLARRTAMKIHRAEEGMVMEPDSVYLIPPRKNLRIFHGKLLLTDQDHGHGLNLPIDIFFKALAEDQGEKAVSIILSGTGSDGTRGVRAIKESGGMVIVQDEESAQFDGMPRSAIATGVADFILPPGEMPAQLAAYVSHPYASKSELSKTLLTDEDGLARIFSLLREHSKIDFTYYKPSTVLRRIERRMTINQLNELNDYVRYLENHRSEVDILHRELLIGVTNFFRDPDAFDLLAEKYLESILANVENREVRIWVAGCSTGEEAYTIAILCREAMEQAGLAHDVKIFATDVDRNAIERAGVGIYPESIVTDVPARLLSKYFIRNEDNFRIARNIREMVVFAQHNLIKDPPFTNIDLLTCRNLLIYLQPVLQRKAMELFNFSLNSGAILMLGTSETTGDMGDYFESIHNKWKMYRCRGKRKPTGLDLDPSHVGRDRVYHRQLVGRQAAARLQHEEERVLDRFLQAFAGDYVCFAMALNSNMEIIHILGDTDTFIKMPSGMMSTDASKLVHKSFSIPLSTGVQKVLKKNEPLTFSKIRVSQGKEDRLVQMRVKLLPQRKGQDPLVGVFVTEMVERNASDASMSDGVTFDVSKEAEDRILDLEHELQFTRENLQATVEELETSNEELQATNEELLASNEELQSTNEELQSVNEELYTVNAEYQSKITELTEITNDLDNLLESTHIATLFLDENLEVRRFSGKVTELLNLIENDIGRPLSHISHKLGDIDLSALAKDVLHSEKIHEEEYETDNGHWYLLRAIPYRIASEVYSGIVMIFIDITALKKTEIDLQRSQVRYTLAQRAARIGTWEWDVQSNEVYWSDNIEELFGLEEGTFRGTYDDFLELLHPDERELVAEAVREAIEKDKEYSIDHRIVLPDGTLRWMSENGEVQRDKNGNPLRMIGTVQDISGKKRQEQELRQMCTNEPTVLVVDDDPATLTLLTAYLKELKPSLNVVTASDGFDGLVKAGRYNPKLIVSDLVMPGMDGFHMISAIKSDLVLKNVPLLIVTMMDTLELRDRGGLPEGIKVIQKPLEFATIEDSLKRLLNDVFKENLSEGDRKSVRKKRSS